MVERRASSSFCTRACALSARSDQSEGSFCVAASLAMSAVFSQPPTARATKRAESCAAWLTRYYKSEYPRIDELAPRFGLLDAPGLSIAPLPDPG